MTENTITRAELARLGVKAAGGVRTTGDALAMIAAGATRIGASHTEAILDGLPDE
jgi:deoxyribose-phosphate aldolase